MQHVKKLPGFRSGSRRNAVIASVVYALVALTIVGALVGGGDDGGNDSAAEIVTPTATTTPAPEATATPAPVQPALVTEAGMRYVDAARDFLSQLDAAVARVESGEIADQAAWEMWSVEWNRARQPLYDECAAQPNLEVGARACVPLGEVRSVWSFENDRLWHDGSADDVTMMRQQLDETLAALQAP